MVTIRVRSKFIQAENRPSFFLQIKAARILHILRAFLIKKNILLALVGYEMIIANSYSTRTLGITLLIFIII